MLQQVVYAVGYGLCHQLPSRSFVSGGIYYPVCARDCGIYLGLLLGLAVMALMYRRRDASAFFHPVILTLAVLMFVPMVVDGVSSYAGLRTTTNLLRFFTGYSAGYSAGTMLFWAARTLLERHMGPRSLLDSPREAALWFIVGAGLAMVIYLAIEHVGVVGPLVMVLVIIGAFWILIMMIGLLISPVRARITGRAGRCAFLVATLLLSCGMIVGLGCLKHLLLSLF